jgi:hypothetical protein
MTTPATTPGYSEQAAAQLRKAVEFSNAVATPDAYTDRDRERLREARDDAFRAADGFISLAAIEEGVDIGAYGPAVALQDLDVRTIGDDGGPG